LVYKGFKEEEREEERGVVLGVLFGLLYAFHPLMRSCYGCFLTISVCCDALKRERERKRRKRTPHASL
jgi:hypothetical protein